MRTESTSPGASPAPLFEFAVDYWNSCALFAAIELGIFEAIGDGGAGADNLQRTLDLPARPLSMLLDALTAMAVLDRGDDGRIRHTPMSAAFLRLGEPGYLGDTIMFNARTFGAWGDLAGAVRRDAPPQSANLFLGEDPEATENFVLAMHHRALGVARCLVQMLNLEDRRTLLDVGGGPATYTRLLVETYPDLHARVLDLPAVVDIARKLISDSAARDRIELVPGDMFNDEFGADYDAVLMSGVLHRTEGDGLSAMIKKGADALVPGGILAVSDLFTGRPDPGPVLPELFSLHMLVTAEAGRSLPLPEMESIYNDAGLDLSQVIPYPAPLPHTLCIGVKRK